MPFSSYQTLIEPLLRLTQKASAAILRIYHSDNFQYQLKKDNSPLTQADLESHDILYAGLTQLAPSWRVISEESQEDFSSPQSSADYFWLIDPLDGTKEFIHRSGEFAINIALIHQQKPVLGMIHIPITNTVYYAFENGGAFKQVNHATPIKIQTRPYPKVPRIVVSRRHNDSKLQTFLQSQASHELVAVGSALKICLVAEGGADLYPRLSPTYQWDTAAGQCIIEEAQGRLLDLSGNPLKYNADASLINPEFIVSGDRDKGQIMLKRGN